MQEALTNAQHPDSSKALGLIKLHMDDSIIGVMSGIDNCRDAWTALENLFASTSSANVMQLKRQLNTLSLKGRETVAAYMQRGKKLQLELQAANSAITDADLIQALLQGVPPSYDMIKSRS
jgi:hypothetical protein